MGYMDLGWRLLLNLSRLEVLLSCSWKLPGSGVLAPPPMRPLLFFPPEAAPREGPKLPSRGDTMTRRNFQSIGRLVVRTATNVSRTAHEPAS